MIALFLLGLLAVFCGLAYASYAGLQRDRDPRQRSLTPATPPDPLEGWPSPPRPLPPAPSSPTRPTRIRVVSRTPPPPGRTPPTPGRTSPTPDPPARPWAAARPPVPWAQESPTARVPSPPVAPSPPVPPPPAAPLPSLRRIPFGRRRSEAERRGAGRSGRGRLRSTGVTRRGCPYCINEIVDGEATRACTAGHTHHLECIESNGGQCAVTHCGHPAAVN
jgi:hypothetical protein